MFTFHDRVPKRNVYFPWQDPLTWGLLSTTGPKTWCLLSMAGIHNLILVFLWQASTTLCWLFMTESHKTMLDFYDRIPQRCVGFLWQSPTTLCWLFMTGSHNVMFALHSRVKQYDVYFPWQGQTTWCLLSMAGSDNVMFTFHGRVRQRDVYFPWQGPTRWLMTPWRERVTQSASSLLTTRVSGTRSTSWESDLPSWVWRKWRWTSRNTATWTLGGPAGPGVWGPVSTCPSSLGRRRMCFVIRQSDYLFVVVVNGIMVTLRQFCLSTFLDKVSWHYRRYRDTQGRNLRYLYCHLLFAVITGGFCSIDINSFTIIIATVIIIIITFAICEFLLLFPTLLDPISQYKLACLAQHLHFCTFTI